jgi:hypothetical protein
MKSAIVFLHASSSTNPKASALYGTQFIPASLVMELYAMLQAGQYDPSDNERDTGEPRFKLNISLWRADPGAKYVLSGNLESPSEYAARKGSQPQQGYQPPAQSAPPGYAPPAPQGPPPGYPQPAPQAAPPGWQAAPQPAPAPGYVQPGPAPQQAPPQQAPGWGGGWG